MKRSKTELPGGHTLGYLRMAAALEDLGDCWMYGPEFRAEYNIGGSLMDKQKSKFNEYCLKYKQSLIWSGSKETIAYLKEKLNA